MEFHDHDLEVKLYNVRLRSSGAGAVLVKVGELVQGVQVGNSGCLISLGLVLVSDESIKVGLSSGGTHTGSSFLSLVLMASEM